MALHITLKDGGNHDENLHIEIKYFVYFCVDTNLLHATQIQRLNMTYKGIWLATSVATALVE